MAAQVGLTLAKLTLGFEHALALCAIAENDPKRKSSTDRYFSWLLKMIMTGDGHAIVAQAAERANSRIQTASPATRSSVPSTEIDATAGDDPPINHLREAIRADNGPPLHDSWIA